MIKKFIKYTNRENIILRVAKRQNKPYDRVIWLDCHDNQLTNLDGIENLVNLKILYCFNNQLTSLKGIEKLVNLNILDCYDNLLNNLDGIENLINLKRLDCSNNKLTSLEGIEKLVNLEKLECYDNQLSNVDLEGIEDLYNIGIDGMGLFDNFKNLKYLNIQNNNLSEKYKNYLRKKFKNIDLLV